MANTISELYEKYAEQVEGALEEDRYFQYLFEMVQAGENTIDQKNRVLHKVVDETWLKVIEEGIDAIFNIVDKPRRFITTSEEVVPVALAKKITADSVRHLSMNTQFIASDENGDIQPTRVLNVTTEESYDLYENRFIYHLIQRLFAFVDKRTDVIFWSTGDETCNVMSMESKVDDAYEEISYKIEMTIKNRQSYAENDSDNMEIFKRIDRLRRMVRTLRSSAFCEIMSGCAKVHSPIQRTNLMMKDPSYRTCYKLWQFMESYDDVGYTIEERDTALEFDEEYLLQMYTNMITNYTVFKSLLESDPRKMSELAEKKYEPVRPKFVREIKEEIVEDRNIPDVEIRQVFVEEVTQAQLEAEEKLKQETERCQELERQNGDLEWEKETLSGQLDFETQARIQAEQQSDVLQAQFDAVQSELENEKGGKKALEEQLHEAELAREAAERHAEEEMATVRREADELVISVKKQAEQELETAKAQAEADLTAVKQEAERALAELKHQTEQARVIAEKEAAGALAAAQQQAEQERRTAELDAQKVLKETKREAQEKLTAAQKKAERAELEREALQAQLDALRRELAAEKEWSATVLADAKREAAAALEAQRRAQEETIRDAERKAVQEAETARREAASEIRAARREGERRLAEAQRSLQESEKERCEVQERLKKLTAAAAQAGAARCRPSPVRAQKVRSIYGKKIPVYVDQYCFAADHCGGGRSAGACIIYTVRAGTAGAWLYDAACHDREHGADVCD